MMGTNLPDKRSSTTDSEGEDKVATDTMTDLDTLNPESGEVPGNQRKERIKRMTILPGRLEMVMEQLKERLMQLLQEERDQRRLMPRRRETGNPGNRDPHRSPMELSLIPKTLLTSKTTLKTRLMTHKKMITELPTSMQTETGTDLGTLEEEALLGIDQDLMETSMLLEGDPSPVQTKQDTVIIAVEISIRIGMRDKDRVKEKEEEVDTTTTSTRRELMVTDLMDDHILQTTLNNTLVNKTHPLGTTTVMMTEVIISLDFTGVNNSPGLETSLVREPDTEVEEEEAAEVMGGTEGTGVREETEELVLLLEDTVNRDTIDLEEDLQDSIEIEQGVEEDTINRSLLTTINPMTDLCGSQSDNCSVTDLFSFCRRMSLFCQSCLQSNRHMSSFGGKDCSSCDLITLCIPYFVSRETTIDHSCFSSFIFQVLFLSVNTKVINRNLISYSVSSLIFCYT